MPLRGRWPFGVGARRRRAPTGPLAIGEVIRGVGHGGAVPLRVWMEAVDCPMGRVIQDVLPNVVKGFNVTDNVFVVIALP